MIKKIFRKSIYFLFFTKNYFIKFLMLLLLFIGITIHQNNSVTVTRYKVSNEKIPKSFNNFKIVQLSDIQNDYQGEKIIYLYKKIKKEKPDIIVITGDLVDLKKYNKENTLELLDYINDVAPIYFVYGNHEIAANIQNNHDSLIDEMKDLGVRILDIESDTISIDGEHINIIGIQDPSAARGIERLSEISNGEEIIRVMIDEVLNKVTDKEKFTLLLSHRPEYFEAYISPYIDLVLSGHAHGGQIRLPFIGGLYSPNQGYFPKYTSGVHKIDNTKMIISRGLGNSYRFSLRIFNTPEIVSITLKSK